MRLKEDTIYKVLWRHKYFYGTGNKNCMSDRILKCKITYATEEAFTRF
jgi:hypothetical protein